MSVISIRRLSALDLASMVGAFGAILVDSVSGGASVGFLTGLSQEDAMRWWLGLTAGIEANEIVLFGASLGAEVLGTVQLQLATKPNAAHRAEVAKLLVHSNARKLGIARMLMSEAENEARALGRTLLVLDTQSESPAEKLYRSLGYHDGGLIPEYAALPDGRLTASRFFWKKLRLI